MELNFDNESKILEFYSSLDSSNYKYVIQYFGENRHVITGMGFETEEKAFYYAQKIRSAVLYYGFKYRRGINFGEEYPRWFFAKEFLESTGNNNVRVLHDHDKIIIYDDTKETYFISNKSTYSFGSSIDVLRDTLLSFTKQNISLSQKDNLALELYNSYYFQDSLTLKFLLLIMIVECLSEQQMREEISLNLVNSFIKELKSTGIPLEEKCSLLGSLQHLRKESISQSCVKLVKLYLSGRSYCEMDAIKFFKYCYGVRSKIVHNGQPPKLNYRFDKLTSELHNLIADLLTEKLNVT